MFTTIAKLRASSAMQSRVTTVESWLKKQQPGYTPESKFPIAFIGYPNAVADVEWVNASSNTHAMWPELANEVLKEFGHSTQTAHRDEIETMLNSGKANALEEIKAKYNAAFARTVKADFGSAWWPFAITAAAPTPATALAETPVAATSAASSNENTVAEKSKQDANEEEAGNETPEVEATNPVVLGAMYIGLGKVMVEKQKTLAEAAKWSTSPTGGRMFSEYVHAFASGVDLKEVRATLKQFAATV